MVLTIILMLFALGFALVGGYIGYYNGYDRAWLDAIEFAEEEVKKWHIE